MGIPCRQRRLSVQSKSDQQPGLNQPRRVDCRAMHSICVSSFSCASLILPVVPPSFVSSSFWEVCRRATQVRFRSRRRRFRPASYCRLPLPPAANLKHHRETDPDPERLWTYFVCVTHARRRMTFGDHPAQVVAACVPKVAVFCGWTPWTTACWRVRALRQPPNIADI